MLYGMPEDRPVTERLQQARQRRHVVAAVSTGAESWTDVLALVAGSPDDETAQARLQDQFGLDDIQATAVLDTQFRRVAGQGRQRLADELSSLDEEIARLEAEL